MSTTTSGHCVNSAGIRGHSAGSIFPAVIMIKGNPFEVGSLTYHILNHPQCESYLGWHSYAAAENHAAYTPRHF